MKTVVVWFLLLAGPLAVVAQVPQAGIYRVSKLVDYRPRSEYNYGVKTFTTARHHPVAASDRVRYCLVAVDSADDRFKTHLVFLATHPDSLGSPLALQGGFYTASDSTFSVAYQDASFQQPASNSLRFFGQSFRYHANALTYDSGAGQPGRTYVANDPHRQLTISPQNSLFALHQARPYRTILEIEPERVPFYPAPDTARRSPTWVTEGQYIAILAETKRWYEAETVTPAGAVRHGWLWKPDLVKRIWVPQVAQAPDFRFQVAYPDTADAEAYDHHQATALAIRVISRHTGRVQQLIDSVAQDRNMRAYAENLELIDANFDGYPDLMLFAHDGGAGPNSGYLFYLYHPGTARFALHQELSELTQVDINPRTKTISSGWRNGCCSHGGEEYQFINGALTMSSRHEETVSIDSSDVLVVTKGHLVKSKWREESRRVKASALYPTEKPPAAKGH